MSVVELELTMAKEPRSPCLARDGIRNGVVSTVPATALHGEYSYFDGVFVDPAPSNMDWFCSKQVRSCDIMDLEDGRSSYGATTCRDGQLRRAGSKERVGPAHRLQDEDDKNESTNADDSSDETRRIRLALIFLLLLTLLGIFVLVVLTIVECRTCDEKFFDDQLN